MNLFKWFLLRKVRNAAGELERKGISVTKVCAVVIGLLKAGEVFATHMGHPITVPKEVFEGLVLIGGIGMRDAIIK